MKAWFTGTVLAVALGLGACGGDDGAEGQWSRCIEDQEKVETCDAFCEKIGAACAQCAAPANPSWEINGSPAAIGYRKPNCEGDIRWQSQVCGSELFKTSASAKCCCAR